MFNSAGVGFELPDNVIGLIITGIFSVVVATLGALLARRGAKLGNRETRAPDVQEMWAQQETDRRMRQIVEDLWWNLRRAFQSYYRRVVGAATKLGLSEAQMKQFELTKAEQAAIDKEPIEPK